MVTGNLSVRFWSAPPYLSNCNSQVNLTGNTTSVALKVYEYLYLLPKLDVEERCITEVRQTLDVDDLLHLRTSFYERLHRFSLNIDLWDQLRSYKSTNQHVPQTILILNFNCLIQFMHVWMWRIWDCSSPGQVTVVVNVTNCTDVLLP